MAVLAVAGIVVAEVRAVAPVGRSPSSLAEPGTSSEEPGLRTKTTAPDHMRTVAVEAGTVAGAVVVAARIRTSSTLAAGSRIAPRLLGIRTSLRLPAIARTRIRLMGQRLRMRSARLLARTTVAVEVARRS